MKWKLKVADEWRDWDPPAGPVPKVLPAHVLTWENAVVDRVEERARGFNSLFNAAPTPNDRAPRFSLDEIPVGQLTAGGGFLVGDVAALRALPQKDTWQWAPPLADFIGDDEPPDDDTDDWIRLDPDPDQTSARELRAPHLQRASELSLPRLQDQLQTFWGRRDYWPTSANSLCYCRSCVEQTAYSWEWIRRTQPAGNLVRTDGQII